MNIGILEQYHFINLSEDQLIDTIDFDAIWALAESEENKEALRLLSQFLVGNIEGTFDEVKALGQSEQRRMLQTWAEVLKEPKELQKLVFAITKEVL